MRSALFAGFIDRRPIEFQESRLLIENRIIQEADRIIAECPQDFDDLMGFYRARPAKIRIVPCKIPTKKFTRYPETARAQHSAFIVPSGYFSSSAGWFRAKELRP